MFVFRIKGKLVLQVWIAHDMYPEGNPAQIAEFLLALFGEVQVHSLILTIAGILKTRVGETYLEPTTESHLFTSFDSEYEYVIDFNDEVVISVSNCGDTKTYNIPEFASLCDLDVPKLPHTMPTLKFDVPLEGKEFIQMVNETGKPLFFIAAKDWLKNVSRFVLGVDIHLGQYRRHCIQSGWFGAHQYNAIGEGASGITCLAAQILKKTKQVCGDDALILSDMKHDAMPMHTIACYGEGSDIAIHDGVICVSSKSHSQRQRQQDSVQGIHSCIQNRIVFNKFAKAPSGFGHASCSLRRVYYPSPPPSFIAWVVGNSRNRANWKLTTVKQLRNVLRLITTLSHVHAPPRPSVERIAEKEEGGGKKRKVIVVDT